MKGKFIWNGLKIEINDECMYVKNQSDIFMDGLVNLTSRMMEFLQKALLTRIIRMAFIYWRTCNNEIPEDLSFA